MVLSLGFRYFELGNIYKQIPNRIRIPIFSSEFAHRLDSGAGLVLSIWFVLALVSISENNFIIAKLTIWVWCGVAIIDGQFVYAFTDITDMVK